jgi:Tol biopolymer transport system component/DNA-binding winged helix-turn-helix (wHTH) protein
MGHSRRDPKIICFADYTLDLQTAELRTTGTRLVLQDQPFQILTVLLETPGQLVTREELIKRLWPEGTFVDFEQSLNKAIGRLREALGDNAGKPRFIETLPRKGYRWIVAVSQPSSPESTHPERTPTAVDQKFGRSSRTALQPALVFLLLCGMSVLTATWYWHGRSKETASPVLKPVPVTALPGLADTPALSPDGSRVAFSWTGDPFGPNGVDLYVKSLGTESVLRLTRHAFDFVSLAWSPDGKQIAFYGSSNHESGLYLIQAFGGREQKLRSINPSTQNQLPTIAWSGEGQTIAFAEAPLGGGHLRLQLLSLETQQISQIEHDERCQDESMPAFSHNGKLLAYACFIDSGHVALSIASSQGRSPRVVKEFEGYTLGVAWSGDDKRLIFSHLQKSFPNDRLQEMSLADGSVRDLSFDASVPLRDLPIDKDVIWPNIAGSGGRLVYTMESGGNQVTVWRADLRKPHSPPTKLIFSTRRQLLPQYSPDGKYIAFSSNRGGNDEIWMSDSDGRNLVRLSNVRPARAVAVNWSPDSRRIAFDSRKDGHSEVYLLDVAERTSRKLNLGTMDACSPSWSHDGKWIYFTNGYNETANQLFRVSSGGGRAEAITSTPGYRPTESFDGKGVYFVATPTILEFSTTRPSGTEYRVEGLPPLASYESWTVTHSGIYFFPAGAPNRLSYFDFATKKVRPLLTTKGTFFGISVSPDDHYLLYTRMDDIHGDVMLVDNFR